MSLTFSINELEDLRERFHNWQKNNPQRRVPKNLWDYALDLIVKYSLNDVAKAIDYPSSYVHLKLKKRSAIVSSATKFVEVQPTQTPLGISQIIRMNIQDHKGVVVDLSFHGSVDQTFPLIHSLFREGKSCSK